MKIRIGFVSNSSSTSFSIYGHYFGEDDSTVKKILIEKGFSEGEEDDFDAYEFFEENERCKTAKLSFESSPYGDYIGRNWDTIGDDETGKEFKESTKKAMEVFFGEGIELDYHKQAFNDNY